MLISTVLKGLKLCNAITFSCLAFTGEFNMGLVIAFLLVSWFFIAAYVSEERE